jgi:hypothetical protein
MRSESNVALLALAATAREAKAAFPGNNARIANAAPSARVRSIALHRLVGASVFCVDTSDHLSLDFGRERLSPSAK